MSASILGVENQSTYPVVLARFDDYWQIGFRIEVLENGLVAFFIPDAPNPQSGAIYFMTSDRVSLTDSPLAVALKCLRRLGAGWDALLHDLPVDIASGK